jgi:hypothetical protein
MSILMSFFIFEDTPLGKRMVDVHDRVSALSELMICWAASSGSHRRSVSGRKEGKNVPVYETAKRMVVAARAMVTQAVISGAAVVG